jgi:hypothetical protein
MLRHAWVGQARGCTRRVTAVRMPRPGGWEAHCALHTYAAPGWALDLMQDGPWRVAGHCRLLRYCVVVPQWWVGHGWGHVMQAPTCPRAGRLCTIAIGC